MLYQQQEEGQIGDNKTRLDFSYAKRKCAEIYSQDLKWKKKETVKVPWKQVALHFVLITVKT